MPDALVVSEERSYRSLVPARVTNMPAGGARARNGIPKRADPTLLCYDVDVVPGLGAVRTGEDEVGGREPPADATLLVELLAFVKRRVHDATTGDLIGLAPVHDWLGKRLVWGRVEQRELPVTRDDKRIPGFGLNFSRSKVRRLR